ncbi:histidine ammonia-lyase [Novosphingobium sp. Chol11]|uniref:HAL/PAL/TAL family ammonia-lyase n=1 Tax=Novosphingobium sp. Chol11 TaxID=1385763 RepID=UPI0025ECCB31|nr:histidine ammonia-lyase [Novosphingobium sp. Chol11]
MIESPPATQVLGGPATWREIVAIARGAAPVLSAKARARLDSGRALLDEIVRRNIPAYGINTGIGALCDTVVDGDKRASLSRKIVLSHACGVGAPLPAEETRAVMAAQISNFLHGASGIRIELVEALCALLAADCLPLIPSRGSVGYLSHSAAIALVLIGAGSARHRGEIISGAEAMARIGVTPFVLGAKEGLSLVNGTPCAAGLACLALERTAHWLDWADAAAAMTYENLGSQSEVFRAETLALRPSPGISRTGAALRAYLASSPMLASRAGARTQDALSLRTIPQVHGAVRDLLSTVEIAVAQELASVTDNPALGGTPEAPQVLMGAQAVGVALALAMDNLGTAVADLAMMAERRIDRLVNPLVSGLPAFLAAEGGDCSGFMIAQYTAAALVAENRRLAAPASLDGGITSALQEDFLAHATPAATKALAILDNCAHILAIECLSAAQAYDVGAHAAGPAPRTDAIRRQIREVILTYDDDRPLGADFAAMLTVMQQAPCFVPAV